VASSLGLWRVRVGGWDCMLIVDAVQDDLPKPEGESGTQLSAIPA